MTWPKSQTINLSSTKQNKSHGEVDLGVVVPFHKLSVVLALFIVAPRASRVEGGSIVAALLHN